MPALTWVLTWAHPPPALREGDSRDTPLPVMLPAEASRLFTALGKTRYNDLGRKALNIMAHSKLRPCLTGSIFIFREHTHALVCLKIQPGSSACRGYHPGCNRRVGPHYVKYQLVTTRYQKPYLLSPPHPTDAFAPLQGAKLAENSLCAGWGLGQGRS